MDRKNVARVATAIVVASVLLALSGPAAAAPPGACSERQAKADVKAAKVKLQKAERRLAEAKRVLGATRTYSKRYGPAVARWTRLARRVRWPWSQMPTLMLVTCRESRGDPRASNGGVYIGLMQIWREHVSDPERLTNPEYNLRVGRRLHRESSWQPWGCTDAVR